jgi:glycosyltransferase involved in cell wall biosynthesis
VASGPVTPALARVHELSRLLTETSDPRYLGELNHMLWEPGFTLEQRHFFYWQRLMRHSHVEGGPELAVSTMYSRLFEAYRREIGIKASWIPPQQRAADSIVVITNQLVGLAHAPTADALSYSYLLQTRLGKKVLLVNTADMPWTEQLPYYNAIRFNYMPEYSGVTRLRFKDASIQFYQCKKPMPNLEEARAIIGTVLERKPMFVLSLGHSNVTPDLCSDFLTVATMPFGTPIPKARSNLYVVPRALTPEDGPFLREWRIADEQIIQTDYTFSLPGRTATLSRADLGLPESAYVIAVVGNRLDDEFTTAVAEEVCAILREVPETFVVFLGRFAKYEEVVSRHPPLRERSRFLGHQKDLLAVYECTDAYFNPPRYGGGTSSMYALAMGVPVITGSYGDVPPSVGPRFIFDSPEERLRFIKRSASDTDYRRELSDAAKARFAELSDREAMLRHIAEQCAAKADVRRR